MAAGCPAHQDRAARYSHQDTKGDIMQSDVRDMVRPTPHGLRGDLGKFQGESPFAIWLATRVLTDDSWSDETTGSSDFGRWSALVGRRVVSEDSFGFVSVTTFADVHHARAWFDAEQD